MLARQLPLLTIALLLVACIESNPQPMPAGKDTGGHQVDSTVQPPMDLVSAEDTVSPPADASMADVMADMAAEVMADVPTEDSEVETPDLTDDADVMAPTPPPGVGPARGGIRISSERFLYPEGDEQTISRIHATLFADPIDPFVGVFDQGYPFLDVTATDGPCVLMTSPAPNCPDYCLDGTICKGDTCVPWAKPAPAGTMTIDGLKVGSLTMTMSDYDGMYYTDNQPYDLFDLGSMVTVTTTGADIPAFSADVAGVTPLETGWEKGFVLDLQSGTDKVVEWTAGAPGEFVRLVVKSSNSCHGCPLHAQLVCDLADTGSLTIPAALIDQLPTIYAAEICAGHDCPMSYIERRSCTSIDLPGAPAHLCVTSRTSFLASHN